VEDIVKEAELISAKGAGFTGGDPLCRLGRTVRYIKALKERFGKGFHIHLYTSLDLVNEKNMKTLYNAGLDEIRFHMESDGKLWDKMDNVLKHDWDVGVEIPVIPGKAKDLWKIVRFIDRKNKCGGGSGLSGSKIFLNLNELEIPDNSFHKIKGNTKDDLSYAMKGSEELALRIMDRIEQEQLDINVHYCTARLKDAYQLARRIKRRAKNISLETDRVDSEGLLHRGVIYLEEMKPGFSYRKRLEGLSKGGSGEGKRKKIISVLKRNRINLMKLSGDCLTVDENKLRILCSEKYVKKNRKLLLDKGLCPAIVVEYPTHDALEIEVDFL
jgi:hypothetical protein